MNHNAPLPLADRNFNFGFRPERLNSPSLQQNLLPSLLDSHIGHAGANFAHNVTNELAQFISGEQNHHIGVPRPVSCNIPNANMRAANMENNRYWMEEEKQAENIKRFGGPIRKVDFQGTDVSSAMLGNQNVCGQFNWEPYRNEGFRGQWLEFENDQHQVNHERSQPYARRANWR